MRKIIAVLFVAAMMLTAVHIALAEDDDDRYEREDDSHETESEDWDLSNDFSDTAQAKIADPADIQVDTVKPVPPVPVQVKSITTPASGIDLNDIPVPEVRVPEVDTSKYKDDDGDGIINMNDQYPGQNDLMYIDSDGDGVVDAVDRYPGNDLDYQDADNDGVVDSQDSDITKATDKDHDGIDDYYDTKDDRPFYIKLMAYLGLVR